ncbi:MAG: TSUP family transporter [Oscillospiraceae bacterium]|nr:TSUP family transporter [Oscillospiraceae bacterium]
MELYQQLFIACPLVFLAGFVDSIAGGGGLISLPAYYLTGIPPHFALGTNKMSSSIGTIFSTATYIREGYVYKRIVIVSVIGALIGSWIGARCALLISEDFLRWIMIVLVPVIAVITVFKKDLFTPGERDISNKREQVLTAVLATTIGWYDGFFGPGAGMFLVLAFIGILRLNPVTANGNAKIVNLCSNVAAAVAFAASGKVIYALALPCAVFSILGNLLGAKLTIKNGAKIMKPVMLVVVMILLITIILDLISK